MNVSLIDGHIEKPVHPCEKCKLLCCDGCGYLGEPKSSLVCPKCKGATTVYGTVKKPNGVIKRRRKCLMCNYHFSTLEEVGEKYKREERLNNINKGVN